MELAKEQSGLNQEQSSKYTWSSYFYRQCNEKEVINSIAPLDEFLPENFDLLVETIGKEPLMSNRFNFYNQGESAIVSLIINMLSSDKEIVKERLLSIIKRTHNQPLSQMGSIGGNIATILTAYDKNALVGQNLHGVDLSFTHFSSANLSGCNLAFTILSNVLFDNNTLMLNAKMQNCQFTETIFYDTDIRIGGFDLRRTSLDKLNIFLTPFPRIIFVYPYEELDNTVLYPKENEIIIAYIEDKSRTWNRKIEDKSIKWHKKIDSVFILKYKREKDLIYILIASLNRM